METNIFKDYPAWRNATRPLSVYARKKLWKSLHLKQQDLLLQDFYGGTWEDLLIKNEIDSRIKKLTRLHGEDFFSIRVAILLRGKPLRVGRKFWLESIASLKEFPSKFKKELFGGILWRRDEVNPSTMILQKDPAARYNDTEPSDISVEEILEVKTFLSAENTFCDFMIFLGLTRKEIEKYAKIDLEKLK